jgi:hypothetical protein
MVILGWYRTPPHEEDDAHSQHLSQEANMRQPLEEFRPDAAPFLLTPRLSDEPVDADEADDDDVDDEDEDGLDDEDEIDDEDDFDDEDDLDDEDEVDDEDGDGDGEKA